MRWLIILVGVVGLSFPVVGNEFEPLTRAEPVVRMVLQEANNEPFLGMVTVAGTAFDRLADKRWPNTIKRVIYQKAQYTGMALRLRNYSVTAIEEARTAVRLARAGVRPCGKVMWYHSTQVRPRWATALRRVCRIGNHNFYGDNHER